MPGSRYKRHGGLEHNIQAYQATHLPQTLKGGFRDVSFITHKTAHNMPVLLFRMTAIIPLVGTRPSKGNLLLAAVSVEVLIDELAAVVRVYAKKRERWSLPHMMHRLTDALLPFTPYRQASRSATSNIHGTEEVEAEAFNTRATVSHEVCFHECGLILSLVANVLIGMALSSRLPGLVVENDFRAQLLGKLVTDGLSSTGSSGRVALPKKH